MGIEVNVMLLSAFNNCGYPRDAGEPVIVTRGARKPEKFESIQQAREFQHTLPGSTLTYKVVIPPRERLEVLARLAKMYPARTSN